MFSALAASRLRLLECGRWAVLLALFAIPINKPATSIFLFLALLCSFIGPLVKERLSTALHEPIVQGCLIWFAVLAVSALHASDNLQRWADLGVYKALLYPLLVATLLTSSNWRERGLMAFGGAVTLVMLLSWGQLFGLVPMRAITSTFEAYRYTVFKDYSQQGLQFLMLAALCGAYAAHSSTLSRRLRGALWLIAALALSNVIFLLQSRTSWLVIIPLLLYWGWRGLSLRIGWLRSLLVGTALLMTLAVVAGLTPRVQERMAAAGQDISHYLDQHEATSLGIRLELWQRTLPIIAQAPWIGHGLGGWLQQYHTQTQALSNFDAFQMGHPHQEALLVLAEEGAIGLLILMLLLFFLARHLHRLPVPQRDFFASLLLIYLTASLANCLLIDFVHRHGFLLLLACIPLLSKLPQRTLSTVPQS
jgi:O-antigen ligase